MESESPTGKLLGLAFQAVWDVFASSRVSRTCVRRSGSDVRKNINVIASGRTSALVRDRLGVTKNQRDRASRRFSQRGPSQENPGIVLALSEASQIDFGASWLRVWGVRVVLDS